VSERRRIDAWLEDAVAVPTADGCAVKLVFRGRRGETLEGLADLGPAESVESTRGVATVLRLLRAARRRAPQRLLGAAEDAARRLAPARGLRVRLEVRARVRLRFTAWTEQGPLVVDDVQEVREDAAGFLVRRLDGRLPARIPRADVLRHHTSRETWLEITAIDRI
jgi:hypothetical protein